MSPCDQLVVTQYRVTGGHLRSHTLSCPTKIPISSEKILESGRGPTSGKQGHPQNACQRPGEILEGRSLPCPSLLWTAEAVIRPSCQIPGDQHPVVHFHIRLSYSTSQRGDTHCVHLYVTIAPPAEHFYTRCRR
jgi:hypothetical protein